MKTVIERDTDADNPREQYDHLCTMVCFHRRYNIGDKHRYSGIDELLEELEGGDYLYRPIYMFDHSGVTIRTTPFSCPWDSGLLGYIFVKKGEEGLTDEQLTSCLESEVKEYDDYLTGEVYGYTVTDEYGDVVDSCWGFYGYAALPEEIRAACV